MKNRDKELVVFDFDGTLVDSMLTFADIAARVMNEFYDTPYDVARRQYIETSGLPFFQQLEQIYPGHKDNKLAADKFETEKLIDYFKQSTYSDASSTTEYLRNQKIKTAVSSNNFQTLVEKFIAQSNLKLDFVLGFKSETFCKGRPHFEYLIHETGLDRDKVVFVGDSLKDAERALDAGVDFIGKTGLFDDSNFKKISSDIAVINNLIELTEIY